MATHLNHVAIAAPRNGTTSHTVTPSSGTVVAGTAFTPTAGRLLVCVVEGSVTSSTPSGWTLPSGGSAVNNTGLYVWYRTAAGSDSLTTTHNGSDYPVVFHFFEFAAGSTFAGAAASTGVDPAGGAGPSLTGLSGAPWVAAAVGQCLLIGANDSGSTTWSAGTELADTAVAYATTDGYLYSLTHVADFGSSTWSAAATTTVYYPPVERLVFAVAVAAGTTPVTSTRSTSWHTAAQVVASRSTSWTTRAAVTASRGTTWDVRAAVTAARATAWHVAARVESARSSAWHVAAIVGQSRSTMWDARAQVASARATGWGVLTSVLADRSTAWHTRAGAEQAVSTLWHVAGSLTTVTASVSSTWHARTLVEAQQSTAWHLRSSVTTIRATGWTVRVLVAQPTSTTWGVRRLVAVTRSTTWHVDGALVTVSRAIGVTWHVHASAARVLATAWAIRALVDQTRSTWWHVQSLVPVTTAWSEWDGTSETPLTLAGQWDGTAIQPLTLDTVTRP